MLDYAVLEAVLDGLWVFSTMQYGTMDLYGYSLELAVPEAVHDGLIGIPNYICSTEAAKIYCIMAPHGYYKLCST